MWAYFLFRFVAFLCEYVIEFVLNIVQILCFKT